MLGVFGGSGFYSFLDDVEEVRLHTPYGPPAGPVHIGTIGDQRVAFLARHGPAHEHPPHRVPYRANLWAMREVGVQRLLSPCAAGSLQVGIRPGDFVVLDQLVDRTNGRADTFFDGGVVGHVPFADPYCPSLRSAVLAAGQAEGLRMHDGGTVVVIQGPRFSTRAESRWYRAQGWEVINMTQYPEAVLARELGLCFCGIALITDYDTGVEGAEGAEDGGVEGVEAGSVTIELVFEMLRRNVDRTRSLLQRVLPGIEPQAAAGCSCPSALSSGPLGP